MSDLRSLYEEVILDHNRRPRNFLYRPEGANRHAHGYNPLCGDDFTVSLRVEDGVIRDVGFEGAGCAISTASASLMTEAIKGKRIEEVERLFENVHELLTRDGEPADLGKLRVLAGVREYPARVKCATLAWHTLHAALQNVPDTVTTE
ncbi:nitrogen fixation protein NifU [Sulfurifustis variabilis]|uniref:Nitrogen fixation protein NifU n=1 Tax=Sulfurifustis variabilis TaxID=1675686 RepID=A0A1B4V3J8_9GAMM|nr:SUF system NifU family Fe-S cluster assembly protein [Sulfurifustis variabilis]BAU48140.1 nitrogen fixation protein NifU [Sulfurifustis variabilis]